MKALGILLGLCCLTTVWGQTPGPFAPAARQPGSTALPKDTSLIQGWAGTPAVSRGYLQAGQPALGLASFGTTANAAGPADGEVISLGDGGSALYTFNPPLQDGPGADIAVFENGLSDNFLELALVEVSSDGENFYRFPATSLTDTSQQIGAFGALDPTQLNNLAGKYRVNFGVPFDFAQLQQAPLLDISAVSHLKIIDVVGSVIDSLASFDQNGRAINDPYPTAFASGGFDLDAVAVLGANTIGLERQKNIQRTVFYPNPCRYAVHSTQALAYLKVYNAQGQCVMAKGWLDGAPLSVKHLKSGVYWVVGQTAAGESFKQTLQKRP